MRFVSENKDEYEKHDNFLIDYIIKDNNRAAISRRKGKSSNTPAIIVNELRKFKTFVVGKSRLLLIMSQPTRIRRPCNQHYCENIQSWKQISNDLVHFSLFLVLLGVCRVVLLFRSCFVLTKQLCRLELQKKERTMG